MTEPEKRLIRDFIYFIVETGQLSGEDNDFIKAMYYDFLNFKKEGVKTDDKE